jgi:hypothetical protein
MHGTRFGVTQSVGSQFQKQTGILSGNNAVKIISQRLQTGDSDFLYVNFENMVGRYWFLPSG